MDLQEKHPEVSLFVCPDKLTALYYADQVVPTTRIHVLDDNEEAILSSFKSGFRIDDAPYAMHLTAEIPDSALQMLCQGIEVAFFCWFVSGLSEKWLDTLRAHDNQRRIKFIDDPVASSLQKCLYKHEPERLGRSHAFIHPTDISPAEDGYQLRHKVVRNLDLDIIQDLPFLEIKASLGKHNNLDLCVMNAKTPTRISCSSIYEDMQKEADGQIFTGHLRRPFYHFGRDFDDHPLSLIYYTVPDDLFPFL